MHSYRKLVSKGNSLLLSVTVEYQHFGYVLGETDTYRVRCMLFCEVSGALFSAETTMKAAHFMTGLNVSM